MTNLAFLIAATIYLEAAGESTTGKLGVATTMWNRADGNVEKIEAVILKPKQFSCWNGRDPKTWKAPTEDNPIGWGVWKVCLCIGKELAKGIFEPIGPWNHYYAPRLASPLWGLKMKNVKVIGNHKFGRL